MFHRSNVGLYEAFKNAAYSSNHIDKGILKANPTGPSEEGMAQPCGHNKWRV
jgi:hypothetical protein